MKISLLATMLMIGLPLVQALTACAPRAPQSTGAPPTRVTLPSTEVRQLKSTATGRDYDIYVRLPDTYAATSAKKYPVLYVLDGQWDFKLLDSICGGLVYDGFMPETIIVGITYSGDNPDYSALRAMDYSPVPDVFFPDSGDGPRFHTFLKEQLIPFIEENYQADPSQRVLMGSSFGGTFTLYAMFSEPTLFNGYIAGSPVVTYGSRFAFKQEADYAGGHTDLPVRLFLTVGGAEDLAGPVQEFMQTLAGRDYAGFALETRVIADEGHASNKPEAYNRGLRFIFAGE